MQIGHFACCGIARIDYDDLHIRPLFLHLHNALKQNRMAPRRVRSNQHDEIGQFQIFVIRRHEVFAERAFVSCDRRRHAQPRIRIDIRAADIALHQFVSDVVVFGEQLSRDIERHRVRPVFRDDARKPACYRSYRITPRYFGYRTSFRIAQFWRKQTAFESYCIAQSGAFHAQTAKVRWMRFIACNRNFGCAFRRRVDTTADAAIRARCLDGSQSRNWNDGDIQLEVSLSHSVLPNNKRFRRCDTSVRL